MMKNLIGKKLQALKFTVKQIEKFNSPYGVYGPYEFNDIFLAMTINGYGSKYIQTRGYFLNKGEMATVLTLPSDFADFTLDLSLEEKEKVSEVCKRVMSFELPNLINYKPCSIGSDPEIFVEKENGELLPAFKFLGSKKEATIVDEWVEGFRKQGAKKVYWDGYQAEFETNACTCLSWHVDSIYLGLDGILAAARKIDPKARLSPKTVFDIPEEMLKNDADEHVQFGCMPSYNNYNMEGIKTAGRVTTYRSTGGHIHFGCGALSPDKIERIVYALDAILGVACVSMFASFDDPRRRNMYGLAGEYRLPPHGLEYRTLSNAWLFHPLMTNFVFDLARMCFNIGFEGILDKAWNVTKEEVIQTINTCDVDKAREILNRNKEMMTTILSCSYSDKPGKVFEVFLNGAEHYLETPRDIEKNWRIGSKTWIAHNELSDTSWRSARNSIGVGKKAA